MEPIYEHGRIKVVQTTCEHIPAFYPMVKDAKHFWDDSNKNAATSPERFEHWFRSIAIEAFTGLYNGRPIGCVFISHIDSVANQALIGFFKKSGAFNPVLTRNVLIAGLPWLMDRFNLRRLIAMVLQDHPFQAILLSWMGFSLSGIVRQYAKINGKWADFIQFDILRGDLK